ncbi:hypothetical protein PT276_10780 [Orbaceae bacterium ESL0721]|nr:hypothetical protein [Orbaceae bacterium ESL0721]
MDQKISHQDQPNSASISHHIDHADFIDALFVWTIVLTYMLPTVKTWDTPFTIIEMYSAMFILGGAATAMLGLYRIGTWLFLIGAAVTLIVRIPYFNLMRSLAPELANAQCGWVVAQSLLLILATILIIFNGCCRQKRSTSLYLIAFFCTLVSTLCGRILFYNLWIIPM